MLLNIDHATDTLQGDLIFLFQGRDGSCHFLALFTSWDDLNCSCICLFSVSSSYTQSSMKARTLCYSQLYLQSVTVLDYDLLGDFTGEFYIIFMLVLLDWMYGNYYTYLIDKNMRLWNECRQESESNKLLLIIMIILYCLIYVMQYARLLCRICCWILTANL